MLRFHSGFSKLIRIHLAESLVALNWFLISAPTSLQFSQLPVQFSFGIRVDEFARFAPLCRHLNAVQRRNRRIHSSLFDQRSHVPEEQCEQQSANMRPINISIRHHDDLRIPSRVNIKAPPRASAYHLNNGRALGIRQHVRGGGFLHIQNLATNGKQGLKFAIARYFGSAKCGIALDNKKFRTLYIVASAIRQFGRQ